MKTLSVLALIITLSISAEAQIGIGTTTPNSTLDVRGSIALNYRAFTSATTVTSTDNILVFTGSTATIVTLPDATTCTGRNYRIKNASTTGPTPVLTIATTSSQTIDGSTTQLLNTLNQTVLLVSNGANWYIASQSQPDGSGINWSLGGNSVSSLKNLGTTSNFDLPFITNNTEKMRITAAGNVGIGSTSFAASPEALLVYQNSSTSFNVISGKGNLNNYLQLNIQNLNAGTSASSDIVATADNGNESGNYVDLGINSSANTSTGVLGAANTAYLYSAANDFAIGNSTASKNLMFFTGGTASTNERMRIDGNGNVGIGTTTIPKGAVGAAKVAIDGTNASMSGPHMQFTTASDNYPLFEILPWQHDNVSMTFDGYWDGSTWRSSAASGGSFNIFKNSNKLSLRYSNVSTQGGAIAAYSDGIVLDYNGNVGIGSSNWDATNPEQLLVDAGTTSSFNVISGKGTINNYLQLNIQNKSNGGQASSDVVATADNGSETSMYIDMGVNSSGYNNSGSSILAGVNNAYLYTAANDFIFGNSSSGKNLIFFNGGSAPSNEAMRINSSGNIGIGTSTINDKLVVAGNITPSADNSYTLGRSGIRWSAVWSANGTIQTSDIRLKTNILPLNYGLNEVIEMQPVRYNWKTDPNNHNKIGLIAQEVRKIVPEVVTGDESKETLGMNYAELVPVLINAIKDLKQQLDDVKKAMAELRGSR